MHPSRMILMAVVAAAIALTGCNDQMGQVAPSGPDTVAQGQVKGNRYLNRGLGVYWYNLGAYKPLPPGKDEDFVFGWQDSKGQLLARFWVLPLGASPREAAGGMAHARGWRLDKTRDISWQGRPAAYAAYASDKRQGKLLALAGEDWMLVVAADVPAGQAGHGAADLAQAMAGLRIIPPGDVLHTVRSKAETLAVVALWYTGSANRWAMLKKYNKLSTTRLMPGQEILIPAGSVWRLEPMPVWMQRFAHKKQATGKKAADKTDDEDAAPDLEMVPAGPK